MSDDERLAAAMDFVRSCLRGFGQEESDETVRRVAERVLKVMPKPPPHDEAVPHA